MIANGKSFGNKIYIAPEAQPDDGIFSTFIATDMSLMKFLHVLLTIKMKRIVPDTRVIILRPLKLNSLLPFLPGLKQKESWPDFYQRVLKCKKERFRF